MKKISVVIGANYGDEGKGLVTDYLSDEDTMVIRFNGGAQAGHTVVTPEGLRHVFHHFGSGTLRGAATFLSPFFITNPMLFRMEHDELCKKTKKTNFPVCVDPSCFVTTPFDMMINHASERRKGKDKHGSCGIGINETIERSSRFGYMIKYGHLSLPRELKTNLEWVRDKYVPLRSAELGIPLSDMPHLYEPNIITKFVEDCVFMHSVCARSQWKDFPFKEQSKMVFEGAQGLCLDEEHKNFPYVTRSKTGFSNVAALLRMAHDGLGFRELVNTYYVTRTYFTRHGAGPLNRELGAPPYPGIVDATNVPNVHQDSLRFALFDFDDFFKEVKKDILLMNTVPNLCTASAVVTCADQVENGMVNYLHDNKWGRLPVDMFLTALEKKLNWCGVLASYGPTRNDIRKLQEEHDTSHTIRT